MLFSTAFTVLALAGRLSAVPVAQPAPEALEVAKRTDISTPFVNITDLQLGDLGEISPIEDGFLEQDNDAGGETGDGGTAVSNSNGFGGTVGSGQSAQNPNGVEGTSAACSLTGCATSGAAANNQSTSSSSSSSGLINAPLVNGPVVSGPLLVLGNPAKRFLRRFFSA